MGRASVRMWSWKEVDNLAARVWDDGRHDDGADACGLENVEKNRRALVDLALLEQSPWCIVVYIFVAHPAQGGQNEPLSRDSLAMGKRAKNVPSNTESSLSRLAKV